MFVGFLEIQTTIGGMIQNHSILFLLQRNDSFSNMLHKSRVILLDNIKNDPGGVLNKQINCSLKGKLIRKLQVRDYGLQQPFIPTEIDGGAITNQPGRIGTNRIQNNS